MAPISQPYAQALLALANGSLHLATDTLRVLLVSKDYVPDVGAHALWQDLGSNEITGTGYTSGGVVVANVALTADPAMRSVRLVGDSVSWTDPQTFRYAVLVADQGGAPYSPLLALYDFVDEQVGVVPELDFTDGLLQLVSWGSVVPPPVGAVAGMLPLTVVAPNATVWRVYADAAGTLVTESSPAFISPSYFTFIVDTDSVYWRVSVDNSGALVTDNTFTPTASDRVYLGENLLTIPSTDPTINYQITVQTDGTLVTTGVPAA